MTVTSVAVPSAYAGSPKRGPVTRLLEEERWLALVLLLPTLVLLGLFIAYPFFKGVELAVTDTKTDYDGALADPAKVNKEYKLLWLGIARVGWKMFVNQKIPNFLAA